MNTLSTGKDRLTEAFAQLSAVWSAAKEVWNDSTRQDFEDQYWTEVERTTSSSIKNLEGLIDSISQAEREVG